MVLFLYMDQIFPLACVGVIAKSIWCLWQSCIGLAQDASQFGGLIMEAGNYVRVRLTYKRSMQNSACGRRYLFLCAFKYFQDRSSVFSEMGSEEYIPVCREGISAFICL